MNNRISITDLAAKKKRGEKIVMFTVYDYPTALRHGHGWHLRLCQNTLVDLQKRQVPFANSPQLYPH